MSTIAWLLILVGLVLVQRITKGRASPAELSEDLSDAVLAMLRGDSDSLGEVLTRSGDSNEYASTPITPVVQGVAGTVIGGAAMLTAAKTLGAAAKGYRWAATGPDYYDCSGLVYRAAQKVGYKGPRFTTYTIGSAPGFSKIPAPPIVGDIVVWPTHHMGVVSGPDRFYSARNPKSGISETSISGFRKDKPVYYRFSKGK